MRVGLLLVQWRASQPIQSLTGKMPLLYQPPDDGETLVKLLRSKCGADGDAITARSSSFCDELHPTCRSRNCSEHPGLMVRPWPNRAGCTGRAELW